MKNKEDVLREFVAISSDTGLTDQLKQQRKELLLLEVLLDVRNLLQSPKRKD